MDSFPLLSQRGFGFIVGGPQVSGSSLKRMDRQSRLYAHRWTVQRASWQLCGGPRGSLPALRYPYISHPQRQRDISPWFCPFLLSSRSPWISTKSSSLLGLPLLSSPQGSWPALRSKSCAIPPWQTSHRAQASLAPNYFGSRGHLAQTRQIQDGVRNRGIVRFHLSRIHPEKEALFTD